MNKQEEKNHWEFCETLLKKLESSLTVELTEAERDYLVAWMTMEAADADGHCEEDAK